MHLGRVLYHDYVAALGAAEAELGDGRGAVLEQALLVVGVGPSPGHDLGPVHRADVVLVGAVHFLDETLGHEAALGQQLFEGCHSPLDW